jgi:hypothetical protein
MDDMGANPASGSEQDPVALIQGQLEREQNPPTTPPQDQKPEPEQETEAEELPDPEPGPEVPPDDGGDDDGEDVEAEQPAEPEPERFTVKIDGKEQQVTREELLAGYQRQADYSRKTAEAAEQRRAAEALAQSVQAERQHYAAQLEQVATVLQAQLPPRPTQADYDADPIGAVQAERRWQDSMGQLQHVLSQREQADRVSRQLEQQRQQESLAQARERLTEMLPEWRKPEIAAKEKPAVANHLRAVGYADHEISAAADPRALVMARESMLYRQLMASKPKVEQRIAQAPKMVKPGASAPAPDRSKQIVQQIKRSGGKDIDAIAALLLT